MEYELLSQIHSPEDIRKMDIGQLSRLAAEMRTALIHKLSATGGHVGPNLGMVEATIALHYVFDTPSDKLVFDVSHQCYPHKMLTGRVQAFTETAHYKDVNGFTNPRENADYDLFSIGHTSTALSLASGIAKARDLAGGKENVVAVVGDGSLGGGMALEGLDFGSTLGTNFIVVVNDNDMSIAENHGGLYADLRLLRHSNGTAEPNIFRSMGYSYRYVNYGNDLWRLIEAFREVKDYPHPVVVHINTMKGMGLPVAESNKEHFHYTGPFDPKSGTSLRQPAAGTEEADYTDIFAEHMLGKIEKGENVAVLTAGTPAAIGFTAALRRRSGRRFIDVGICEQQAVGMSAGLAKAGVRPVFGVVSTFLQRAYDQLSHDVGINNLPAVFPVFHTGLFSMNDETHLGFFDIAMIGNIPNFLYLAPTCSEEFLAMLDWAIAQTSMPVAVRVPGTKVVSNPECRLLNDYSAPDYDIVRSGSKVAIIGAGTFFDRAAKAADLLQEDGINATLINPRSFTYLDTAVLDSLRDYDTVVTLEDGIVEGGFGQKVASYLGTAPVKVVNLGLPKEFLNRYNAAKVAHDRHLDPSQIAAIARGE